MTQLIPVTLLLLRLLDTIISKRQHSQICQLCQSLRKYLQLISIQVQCAYAVEVLHTMQVGKLVVGKGNLPEHQHVLSVVQAGKTLHV